MYGSPVQIVPASHELIERGTVNERCRVTAATSASISGMCGATETTRSRRSNAASVQQASSWCMQGQRAPFSAARGPFRARPPENAHDRPTAGCLGNIVDPRAIFSPTGIFASPCAISSKCARPGATGAPATGQGRTKKTKYVRPPCSLELKSPPRTSSIAPSHATF